MRAEGNHLCVGLLRERASVLVGEDLDKVLLGVLPVVQDGARHSTLGVLQVPLDEAHHQGLILHTASHTPSHQMPNLVCSL